MGKGGPPSVTQQTGITQPPEEFMPAFMQMLNSAFGAARQSAGQFGGFEQQAPFDPLGMGGTTNFTGQPGGFPGGAPQGQGFQPQMGQGGMFAQNQAFGGVGSSWDQPQPGQHSIQPVGGNQFQQMMSQGRPQRQFAPQQQGMGGNDPRMQAQGGGQPQGGQGQPNVSQLVQQQQQGGQGYPQGGFGQGGQGFQIPPNQQGLPGSPGSSDIPMAGGPPIIGSPFPGQFTAGTNPLEVEALMGREMVGRQMGGMGTNLLNLGQAQARGDFLNPASNPFLRDTINYALQPAVSQFRGSVLPGLESEALQSGAFKGSSARDMAIGGIAGEFGRNLAGTAGAIGFENLARERALQQGSGQMLDEAARLQQLSPEILAQAGEGYRGLAQRPLDERLLQFQEFQQAPFRPLMPLASLLQGSDIGSQYMMQTPRPSGLSRGITGALGGAGLGAGIGGALGQGQGALTGLGGLGGLIAGLAG